jgi:hypothetical protein
MGWDGEEQEMLVFAMEIRNGTPIYICHSLADMLVLVMH